MRLFLIAVGLLSMLAVGLASGYQIGWNTKQSMDASLRSRLERFENQEVFESAEEISRQTGVPLYQVLTGRGNK